MNYRQEFKSLSFVQRCALVEMKRERREIFPDKDRNAYVTHKSNQQQKLVRLKKKFAEFRKNKLASAILPSQSFLTLMKLSEIDLAALLIQLGWDYEAVKSYAASNGFSEPSDTEIFWGGFVAGGVEYYRKRQQDLAEKTIDV
jgi:hypothetical protein